MFYYCFIYFLILFSVCKSLLMEKVLREISVNPNVSGKYFSLFGEFVEINLFAIGNACNGKVVLIWTSQIPLKWNPCCPPGEVGGGVVLNTLNGTTLGISTLMSCSRAESKEGLFRFLRNNMTCMLCICKRVWSKFIGFCTVATFLWHWFLDITGVTATWSLLHWLCWPLPLEGRSSAKYLVVFFSCHYEVDVVGGQCRTLLHWCHGSWFTVAW